MEKIDIGHWQFDRHTSLYYFITNADQYIYLRYGGRDAEAAESYLSLDSLELALQQGLQQHALYQQGKLPPQQRGEPRYPRDIPGLQYNVIVQRNCVECHHIADYEAQHLESIGQLDKLRTMFAYPDIRTVGLHLDVPRGLVLERATGAAADAGLQSGDQIVAIHGTPVLTFGDLQFEYDKIPRDAEQVSLAVERAGKTVPANIVLPPRWWYYDVGFRYWSIDPLVYFESQPLSAADKQSLGLPPDGLASRVTAVDSIGTSFGLHALQIGDVIAAVDGVTEDKLAHHVMLYLRLNVTPGQSAQLTVLRDGARLEMELKTKRQFYRKTIPTSQKSED